MLRLLERTAEEGLAHHQGNPVRVYEGDAAQAGRIKRTRRLLARVVGALTYWGKIFELGCGTGDISGPFSEQHIVVGVDCSQTQLDEARGRFPAGHFIRGPLESYGAPACDVVILCEVLEHLENPASTVRNWLSVAEYSIISHPIDEPMGSGLSGGDHCWSFSLDDFKGWFAMGGHELIEHEVFQMGAYTVALGLGKRIPNSTQEK